MPGVRAMLARVRRLEQVVAPLSPVVRWYGSLEAWEAAISAGVAEGRLDGRDMVGVVAAVRRWHSDGVWR